MKTYYFTVGTTLDSLISDLMQSVKEGIEWGNTVAIALTASLLAISLIRFLFDRS